MRSPGLSGRPYTFGMSCLPPVFIAPELIAFIQGPVSIALAATDIEGAPRMGRGLGCRVSAGLDRVTIFTDKVTNEAMLRAAEERGEIAVVFCLPGPEKAVQIKGDQVAVKILDDSDRACQSVYQRRWCEQIAPLGYSKEFALTYIAAPPERLVAVSFIPRLIFDQTPGPKAGSVLTSGAP